MDVNGHITRRVLMYHKGGSDLRRLVWLGTFRLKLKGDKFADPTEHWIWHNNTMILTDHNRDCAPEEHLHHEDKRSRQMK